VFLAFVSYLPINFEINYKRVQQNDLLIIKLVIIKSWLLFELRITQLYSSFSQLNKKFLQFNMYLTDAAKTSTSHETKVNKPFKYISDIYLNLIKGFKFVRNNAKPLQKLTKQLFKTITCKKITWSTELGFNNAAYTAIATGSLWALKNSIYQNIKQNVILKDPTPSLLVKPHFGGAYLNTNLACIFQIKLGHIIITGLKVMVLLTSFVIKGGGQAD
jgi:hypothetical protein